MTLFPAPYPIRAIVSVAVSLASSFGPSPAHAQSAASAELAGAPARDRAAILSMRGEYAVDFAFDETVLLQPGYERASAQRSGADEVVIVVEDSPRRVVLQHILVDAKSGHVTKHWRQDWTYEAAQRFEFSAEQTWTVRAIPADETRGAWTQCVYEVSDAPRYCGTGRWIHAGSGDGRIATWTSDDSWRPLPRREYTKRSDYNAVAAVNRHTITPAGWTHEQFNTKVRRGPDGERVEVAREFGFNEYRRTTDTDFGPAYRYWKATADYWTRVRARWDDYLGRPPGLHLRTKIDGMAMIIPLFTQAGSIEDGRTVADAEIDRVFAEWVESAIPAKGATAVR